MNLEQSLQNIGLTEKEASVYITLLQLKKATAYTISKWSGLKNPTTYVILDNLTEKGYVKKIPRTKTMQYKAIDPDELFGIAEARFINARKKLPQLQALTKTTEYKPKISFYEGIENIKLLYANLIKNLKHKEVVAFYAHAKDTPEELYTFWDEWTQMRKKRNITIRGVTSIHKTTKDWIGEKNDLLSHIKGLPLSIYDSNSSIEVYDNYVLIVSSRHQQATLIDNPDIARTILQIFEIVWGCLPENKKRTA